MIKSKFFLFLFVSVVFFGCSKEDDPTTAEFVAAFEKQSLSLSSEENTHEINIVFSDKAPQNGIIRLAFEVNSLVYGNDADFVTNPPANNGIIEVPVKAGTTKTSFVFKKLSPNPMENEEKSVEFSIVAVDLPNGFSNGNTSLLVTYSESASLGGNLAPNVGGPNEPNQVYVDLSGQKQTVVRRNVWDLGFYTGEAFRVKLNSSLYMMAAELQTTNIDEITAEDVVDLQPQMAFIVAGSNEFVDHPSGDIDKTVIAEISASPENNKVYLLKMGNEIGTENPATGSVDISDEERGWMKIRVLREGDGYILKYADLNSTTHQEVSISKSTGFNFTFFSLKDEIITEAEPAKESWDLNFTTFTEVEELPSGGMTAYGYSDYVATNVLSETKAYRVSTADFSYQDFSAEDIAEGNFQIDQRTIGSSWRSVFPPDRFLINSIFYVIQDSEGNNYKLKFTALFNKNGVRGNPSFEYELL